MDEFEIEITPLDGANERDMPASSGTRGGSNRSPFAPRLTRRDKLRRWAITWGSVLLACVVIVAVSPALRGALGSLARGSTPSGDIALLPGTEVIYFENSTPWGTLLLDGRVVSDPSQPHTDHIAVAPGRHTLVYRDPPFPTLRCHLQVPFSTQDTCPLELIPSQPNDTSLYVRIINLGATPDQLPPEQLTTLTRVINSALGDLYSMAYVPAGAAYLSASGAPAVARESLTATLIFQLNTDPHIVAPYLPGGHLCWQICHLSDSTVDPLHWGLLALARVSWDYTTATGAVVARDAPASPNPNGATALITISAMWDGFWRAMALPDRDQFGVSPICDVASTLLPAAPYTGATALDFTLTQIPARTPADGCLLTTRLIRPGTPPPVAFVLYRFGMLVAANTEARQLYPELPAATAGDQLLAQNIASIPLGG